MAFSALLVWCAVWLVFGREGTHQGVVKGESGDAIERINYLKLISSPTVIANALTWLGPIGRSHFLSHGSRRF